MIGNIEEGYKRKSLTLFSNNGLNKDFFFFPISNLYILEKVEFNEYCLLLQENFI